MRDNLLNGRSELLLSCLSCMSACIGKDLRTVVVIVASGSGSDVQVAVRAEGSSVGVVVTSGIPGVSNACGVKQGHRMR